MRLRLSLDPKAVSDPWPGGYYWLLPKDGEVTNPYGETRPAREWFYYGEENDGARFVLVYVNAGTEHPTIEFPGHGVPDYYHEDDCWKYEGAKFYGPLKMPR